MMKEKESHHHQELYQTSFTFNLTAIFNAVLVLPVFAFISCIVLSLWLDFEASTATHCRVTNFLPSVSAAIGGFQLQKFIWQFFISLQCPPRLFIACVFHRYYLTFPTIKPSFHLYSLTFVDLLENLSLLFLTIVPSTEAHDSHVVGFICFVLCSQLHMILKILMMRKLRNDPNYSDGHQKSLRLRSTTWIINLTCIFISCYFFYRHNTYCEPGIYTLFALCEYIIVITNITFHTAGFYEFGNTGITVDIGSYHENKRKPS